MEQFFNIISEFISKHHYLSLGIVLGLGTALTALPNTIFIQFGRTIHAFVMRIGGVKAVDALNDKLEAIEQGLGEEGTLTQNTNEGTKNGISK